MYLRCIFHNVSLQGKVLLGPGASCDDVVTQFGSYKSWLQSLTLFLGAWHAPKKVFWLCFYFLVMWFIGCVPVQGLHPWEAAQRRAKAVPVRRLLQMQHTKAPSFPSFWRMHSYCPSWPHISQDSLCSQKRRKKERKWRHHMA